MKTIDNILKFIEEKGYSIREFEDKAGITNGTIGKASKRNSDLSQDNIQKIVEYYSTELEGSGYDIIDLSSFGGAGISILPSDHTGTILKGRSFQQALAVKKNSDSISSIDRIPFYDAEAAAGQSYEVDVSGLKEPTGTIDIGDMLRDSQAAMRVYGNSMIPSYPPGCVIGLRRNHDGFIEPGTVYVIETKSNRYIKRLFYNKDRTGLMCISDSEIKFTHGPMEGEYFYPPFEIPLDSVVALYDVTGVIKRNKNSAIIHQNK